MTTFDENRLPTTLDLWNMLPQRMRDSIVQEVKDITGQDFNPYDLTSLYLQRHNCDPRDDAVDVWWIYKTHDFQAEGLPGDLSPHIEAWTDCYGHTFDTLLYETVYEPTDDECRPLRTKAGDRDE